VITATSLLADLTRRGVRLWANGEFLEYESPKGVLTPLDLAAVRAHKAGLLVELRHSAPTDNSSKRTAQSPFEQFMTELQITEEQVRASFTRNGVQPSYETMQAATWLAFQLNEPWITILGRISKAAAMQFFQAIVQGRCVAGFDDYARVVIRNAARPGARIVL
jgi:hypothetical protein